VFERFTERARKVMGLAYEESERLRHDYIGPEHALAGLARQEDSRAAAILVASGLGPDVIRAGLDQLVAQGKLPGPWRNKADLLGNLGINLAAVQQAVEDSFGMEAVRRASRHANSRSWLREDRIVCASPLNPLAGKALLTKRAFELAWQEAGRLGQHEVRTEHLLLGILRDAQDPLGTGLSRRAKRISAYIGLPQKGPAPVRLIVESSGISLNVLRDQVLAALGAP
jgi:ATP-dependent Clp protease ATP-binding subunit ClpA